MHTITKRRLLIATEVVDTHAPARFAGRWALWISLAFWAAFASLAAAQGNTGVEQQVSALTDAMIHANLKADAGDQIESEEIEETPAAKKRKAGKLAAKK